MAGFNYAVKMLIQLGCGKRYKRIGLTAVMRRRS